MEEYFIEIEAEDENIGNRIDKYLSVALNSCSRSYIQRLLDSKNITVNAAPTKSNYKLRAGDSIHICIPEPEALEIKAMNIPLDIVYEDADIIVVNKPKGMVVHPAPGHFDDTLVNALMYHCRDSLSQINGVMRPGIVHRIDRDTTGLIVACKNDTAHHVMAEKFKVHDITRVYTAIVYNHFSEPCGIIDKPIARHKTDRKKMAIDTQNGRTAVTHYTVVNQLKNNFSLLECRLETGRTHQIRVHMASINHPLLGDDLYGPKSKPFKTDGQMLHAGILGFQHPVSGAYMEFRADLPEQFQKVLSRLL
ncbi:MAG: RluA family pseudouridine synthase [Clostridium sp.]|nr:RluA family pseudouridine synthase [Clostridium sp.]MCM1398823.1 RluA family pseudouridine synthase [Clostridium sp.]MCM1458545.1 RluA family pseudouridine synthase [Bacteroides sp.]